MIAFLLSELESDITGTGSDQLYDWECNKGTQFIMKNNVKKAEKQASGFMGKEFPLKLWNGNVKSKRYLHIPGTPSRGMESLFILFTKFALQVSLLINKTKSGKR
jgi:hypothetical protein